MTVRETFVVLVTSFAYREVIDFAAAHGQPRRDGYGQRHQVRRHDRARGCLWGLGNGMPDVMAASYRAYMVGYVAEVEQQQAHFAAIRNDLYALD